VNESRTGIGEPGASPHLAGAAIGALRGVRLSDGSVGDVLISDGVVGDALTDDGAEPGGLDLDATGWRVLPAACEPHAHLDKALTGPRGRPGGGQRPGGRDRGLARHPARHRPRRHRRPGHRGHRAVRGARDHHDPQPCRRPGRGRPLPRPSTRWCPSASGCAAGSTCRSACWPAARPTTGWSPRRSPAGSTWSAAARTWRPTRTARSPGCSTSPSASSCRSTCTPTSRPTVSLPDDRLDVVDLARQVLERGMAGAGRVTGKPLRPVGPAAAPSAWTRCWSCWPPAGVGIVALPITNLYLRAGGPRTARPAGSPRCAGCSTPASRSPPVGTTCATRSTRSAGPTRSRPRPCWSPPGT